jgi:hypothetical protein
MSMLGEARTRVQSHHHSSPESHDVPFANDQIPAPDGQSLMDIDCQHAESGVQLYMSREYTMMDRTEYDGKCIVHPLGVGRMQAGVVSVAGDDGGGGRRRALRNDRIRCRDCEQAAHSNRIHVRVHIHSTPPLTGRPNAFWCDCKAYSGWSLPPTRKSDSS